MRIIQILTTIAYGDAVSNDTLALQNTLKNNGYETAIFAENIDNRISDNLVKSISELPKINNNDVILYHLSTGTDLNYKLAEFSCRKIVIYHNITPPVFFEGYDEKARQLCQKGYEEMKFLANKVDYCLAASDYNRQNLMDAGYQCSIDVLPILIPFEDYEKTPNKAILNRYKDTGYVNILFTGRIVPNKKQQNIIRAFFHYQKYYNAKSRLFLVGSYSGMEKYYSQLRNYCKELGVQNVYFTGHVKFDEILAYYQIADVFLCESEHEGFCVPLVEAMYFDVPIIAYNSSAVGSTLGGAGILVEQNNSLEIAGIINYLVNHEDLKNVIVQNQRERLCDFQPDKIEKKFMQYLHGFLGE